MSPLTPTITSVTATILRFVRTGIIKRQQAPNDSSSETAEGGGGLAQPVPNGGAQGSQPELEDAPDAEAQAVTDRSRPERFSAAPLLGVFSLRREREKESERNRLSIEEVASHEQTLC